MGSYRVRHEWATFTFIFSDTENILKAERKRCLVQESKDKGNSRFLVRSKWARRQCSHVLEAWEEKSTNLEVSTSWDVFQQQRWNMFVCFFRYRQAERIHHRQIYLQINVKGSSWGRKKVIPGRIQDLDKGMISARKDNYVRKCMTCFLIFKYF